jgi:hypothetical protein
MKHLLFTAIIMSASLTAFSATSPLKDSEKVTVEKILSHFSIPQVKFNDCKKVEFDVNSKVTGFNPAQWTVKWGSSNKPLPQQIIPGILDITNRIPIQILRPDTITMLYKMKFYGKSCGNNPMVWQVTYQEQPEKDADQNNSGRDSTKEIIVPSVGSPAPSADATEE